MSMVGLANGLGWMNIDFTKLLSSITNLLAANGVIGIFLWLLKHKRDFYMLGLIKRFGITPLKIAKTIKKLEQQQLTICPEGACNRRKLYISLTKMCISFANNIYKLVIGGNIGVAAAYGTGNAFNVLKFINLIHKMR